MSSSGTRITAVICSVGRPQALKIAIQSLKSQERVADRIVVVAQVSDTATIDVAVTEDVDVALVRTPGLAQAIERGIEAVDAGVAAFLDDDAVASRSWLRRMAEVYDSSPGIGAVGGRDNVDGDALSGDADLVVGRMDSLGRMHGNHHLGKGRAREVHTLKGANMSVRVECVRGFPLGELVRGGGAQYRNELVLLAAVRRRGYAAIYDPRIEVSHYPAARATSDERANFSSERVRLNTYNELVGVRIGFRRGPRAVHLARVLFLGSRLQPGLLLLPTRPSQLSFRVNQFAGMLFGVFDFFRDRRRLDNLVLGFDGDIG